MDFSYLLSLVLYLASRMEAMVNAPQTGMSRISRVGKMYRRGILVCKEHLVYSC